MLKKSLSWILTVALLLSSLSGLVAFNAAADEDLHYTLVNARLSNFMPGGPNYVNLFDGELVEYMGYYAWKIGNNKTFGIRVTNTDIFADTTNLTIEYDYAWSPNTNGNTRFFIQFGYKDEEGVSKWQGVQDDKAKPRFNGFAYHGGWNPTVTAGQWGVATIVVENPALDKDDYDCSTRVHFFLGSGQQDYLYIRGIRMYDTNDPSKVASITFHRSPRSELETELAKKPANGELIYTEESWNAYIAAWNTANDLYQSGVTDETALDQAKAALIAAYNALEKLAWAKVDFSGTSELLVNATMSHNHAKQSDGGKATAPYVMPDGKGAYWYPAHNNGFAFNVPAGTFADTDDVSVFVEYYIPKVTMIGEVIYPDGVDKGNDGSYAAPIEAGSDNVRLCLRPPEGGYSNPTIIRAGYVNGQYAGPNYFDTWAVTRIDLTAAQLSNGGGRFEFIHWNGDNKNDGFFVRSVTIVRTSDIPAPTVSNPSYLEFANVNHPEVNPWYPQYANKNGITNYVAAEGSMAAIGTPDGLLITEGSGYLYVSVDPTIFADQNHLKFRFTFADTNGKTSFGMQYNAIGDNYKSAPSFTIVNNVAEFVVTDADLQNRQNSGGSFRLNNIAGMVIEKIEIFRPTNADKTAMDQVTIRTNPDPYTKASWTAYQQALAVFNTVKEDPFALQSEVNDAIEDLLAADAALVLTSSVVPTNGVITLGDSMSESLVSYRGADNVLMCDGDKWLSLKFQDSMNLPDGNYDLSIKFYYATKNGGGWWQLQTFAKPEGSWSDDFEQCGVGEGKNPNLYNGGGRFGGGGWEEGPVNPSWALIRNGAWAVGKIDLPNVNLNSRNPDIKMHFANFSSEKPLYIKGIEITVNGKTALWGVRPGDATGIRITANTEQVQAEIYDDVETIHFNNGGWINFRIADFVGMTKNTPENIKIEFEYQFGEGNRGGEVWGYPEGADGPDKLVTWQDPFSWYQPGPGWKLATIYEGPATFGIHDKDFGFNTNANLYIRFIRVTQGDKVAVWGSWSGMDLADKTALAEALAIANSKEQADYTIASWEALVTAIDAAQAVMDDEDALQYQADEALANLNAALAGLVPKSITEISIKTPPTTLTYVEGTTFDPTGGVITVTYDNGTSEDIELTADMCDVTDVGTELGAKTVTVTYGGQTTTFDITVVAKSVVSIAVKTNPDTLTYVEGTTFDPTGGVITVTYDNGTSEDIELTADMCDVTNVGTELGAKMVTVTYEGFTATFDITVVAKSVVGIAVKTNPTTLTYVEGTTFDPTGGVITVTYDNGTSEDIDLTADMCDVTNVGTELGAKTVTVTYGGQTTTFEITVIAKSVIGIVVKTNPDTLTYVEGTTFDPTGGVITVSYNDGTSEDIELTADMCDVTDVGTELGAKTVTVTYEGFTATFDIAVVAKSVIEITVKAKPAKLNYHVGDSLDVTGGIITVTYNNGTSEDIELTADMCDVSELTAVGTVTVTVTYNALTTSFTIAVVPESIESDEFIIDTESDTMTAANGALTVADFKAGLAESAFVNIYDQNGNLVDDDSAVGTGYVVKLEANGQVINEYTIVVVGDTTGEGVIDIQDIEAIANHIFGISTLDGVYYQAANAEADGELDIFDMMALRALILGL